MKILIVGGVAGGATTATRLRRLDEKSEIIIFDRGDYVSFANCGLPYYVGNVIKTKEKLLLQTPKSFKDRFNIDVRLNEEVTKVLRQDKKIQIRKKDGTIYEENYDKLVLSPGAEPINPFKELKDKNKDMNIEKIIQRKYSSTIEKETETTTEAVNVITPLQKLEDALTRIQDQKRKCVDSLHKIENDDRRMELEIIRLEMEASKEDLSNNDNVKDDSFIKALQDSAESAWDDYEEETTE